MIFDLFGKKAPPPDVLVVDDDKDIRGMVQDILFGVGLKTIEAGDGRQAYHQALEHQPRLILLDVDMPIFSGIEALRGLKSEAATRAIPVIMITARQMPRDIDEALRVGAAGYVTKPFEIKRLLKKVAEFIPLPQPPPGL